MQWVKANDAVYVAKSEIISVNCNDVMMLKEKVGNCPDKRIRICTHQTSDDRLHEMMIAITQDSYVRPHKHLSKSESFHLIEGLIDVIIFNDEGEITEVVSMGNFSSGESFFYRLAAPYFHTLLLRTDIAVFHETTNGPLLKGDTVYPSWSPSPTDLVGIKNFTSYLIGSVAIYKRKNNSR